MAEQMTQEQIDALLLSLQPEIEGEKIEYDEIQYHLLICRYCKNIIQSEDLNLHHLLTNSGCKMNDYGHMYVSEEWLKDRKANNIAGWRRTYKLKPTLTPKIRKVPKIKPNEK